MNRVINRYVALSLLLTLLPLPGCEPPTDKRTNDKQVNPAVPATAKPAAAANKPETPAKTETPPAAEPVIYGEAGSPSATMSPTASSCRPRRRSSAA